MSKLIVLHEPNEKELHVNPEYITCISPFPAGDAGMQATVYILGEKYGRRVRERPETISNMM